MTENLEPQDIEKAKRYFNRHESVDAFDGALPPRTIYIRRPETKTKGTIKNGQKLNDDIGAHWSPNTVTARFDKKGNDWRFSFSAVPRQFFSLSWALEAEEIELLDENTLISFCVDNVVTQTGRPYKGELLARFTYIRGTNETIYENKATVFEGRHVCGFSLNDPNVKSSLAYRIWIDLIVGQPRSKTLIFKDPILLLQRRLSLD